MFDKIVTKKIKYLFDLIRLNKPIGFLLLLWPCWFALANLQQNNLELIKWYVYFFFGAFLMRSAGCIINDIIDINLDKKIERTAGRPLTSKKVSIFEAIILLCLFLLLSFYILLQFDFYSIIIALASIPLLLLYPLLKRFTYWPQLFLGIIFNYGLILGWFSINNNFDIAPLIFYIGAIFWTLGYDTIYGFQDIKDDEIVGVKSTSIKFKNIPFAFLIICYSIFLLNIIISGITLKFNYIFFMSLTLLVYHLFFKQIAQLNIAVKKNCLKIFNSNNEIGLIILVSIIIGKILS